MLAVRCDIKRRHPTRTEKPRCGHRLLPGLSELPQSGPIRRHRPDFRVGGEEDVGAISGPPRNIITRIPVHRLQASGTRGVPENMHFYGGSRRGRCHCSRRWCSCRWRSPATGRSSDVLGLHRRDRGWWQSGPGGTGRWRGSGRQRSVLRTRELAAGDHEHGGDDDNPRPDVLDACCHELRPDHFIPPRTCRVRAHNPG